MKKQEKKKSSPGNFAATPKVGGIKIKKLIKKESARNKRTVALSILIMVSMSYMILSLSREELFSGWEIYFVYGYLAVINLLLLLNMLRIASNNRFLFEIEAGKAKIKERILSRSFSIPLDKISCIDIYEKNGESFEVLIIIEKGKRSKSFQSFDKGFIKSNSCYKKAFDTLTRIYHDKQFYCYVMKKAGAVKYYYLYLLYKNCYNAEFSSLSMEYIRRFVEEYDLQ